MSNSTWVTLFQCVGVVSLLLSLASFIGLWKFQDRVAAEKDARIQFLEIEQRGRALSDAEAESLTEDLRSLPTPKIYPQGVQGDRESVRFAHVLKPVFERAGCLVDGVWEDGLIGGAGDGILVRRNRLDTNNPAATIVTILNRHNLNARLIEKDNFEMGRLEVIVGARPHR